MTAAIDREIGKEMHNRPLTLKTEKGKGQGLGGDRRRIRYAVIEPAEEQLNRPYPLRASDTPSTSEIIARAFVGAGL